jgi:hypothetical protein
MTRTLLIAFAATVSLAACKPHTIVAGGPDDRSDDGSNVATTPVALPPAITASKSYRCGDNKLVYVDWMSDGSARVKKSKEDLGVAVPAGSASLKGDAKGSAITYNGESCTA